MILDLFVSISLYHTFFCPSNLGRRHLSNIEITDKNIRSFESTAKKYGIDFALKKDNSEKPPRYLVFFKGRDADVLTMAFNEYSQKILRQKEKPSVRQAIRKLAEIAKSQHKDREKIKDRSIER